MQDSLFNEYSRNARISPVPSYCDPSEQLLEWDYTDELVAYAEHAADNRVASFMISGSTRLSPFDYEPAVASDPDAFLAHRGGGGKKVTRAPSPSHNHEASLRLSHARQPH